MKRLKKGNIFHKRIALIVISLVVILIRFINFPRDDKVLFKIFNLHSIPSLNSVTKPGIFLLSSKYNIQGIVKDDPLIDDIPSIKGSSLIDGISSKFTLEIS